MPSADRGTWENKDKGHPSSWFAEGALSGSVGLGQWRLEAQWRSRPGRGEAEGGPKDRWGPCCERAGILLRHLVLSSGP